MNNRRSPKGFTWDRAFLERRLVELGILTPFDLQFFAFSHEDLEVMYFEWQNRNRGETA